jgi:hypothetical protein
MNPKKLSPVPMLRKTSHIPHQPPSAERNRGIPS